MAPKQFICRKADRKDAGDIAKVHVRSWQAAYRDLLPADLLDGLSVDVRRAGWEHILGSVQGRSATFVIEWNNEIVGFSHVDKAREVDADLNWALLVAIYVQEFAWGQGCGHRLMEASVEFMRWAEYDKAMLWVLDGNERAIDFYSKAGFRLDPSPQGKKLEQLGDVTVREYRYLLDLSLE